MSIDRCGPVRSLYIAVPAYGGHVSTDTAASLVETVSALRQAGMRVVTQFHNGNCYIDAARNFLTANFLESDFSDLLFVDADVGFLPETVLRMCLSERPFVAAIYPKKSDKLEFPIEFLPGERWADKEGLIEVKMVPTGLLRINRMVFDELAPTTKVYRHGDRDVRAFFKTDVREFYYGEDVDFCRVWREAGGRVRIIADAMLAHFGMKSWQANIGDAMKAGLV